jgi:NAD(P)-dependent dehydrogenase (short-subunit alcohol dehydrogenase family)
MNTAIVIGVGPDRGLGAQLCKRFARLDKHVFVCGRTQAKLDAVAADIGAAGGHATAVVADATDEAAIVAVFDQAAAVGTIDVAIYNAGNNTPGEIIDMDADYFTRSWQVCCFGGFLFGREAIRRMQNGGGTLLFTGASASLRGRAGFGAFNSSKAALRTLAQAIAKESGSQGIHVGHVVVDGALGGEKIHQRFPEYAEKLGEAGMVSLEGVVDAFEFLYRQPPTAWSFEVDVRTAIENW